MRGTLHYLWEEAGFQSLLPTMAGKRSWYVIRKYLLQAAEDKTAMARAWPECSLHPRSLSTPKKKNEITQRRLAQMMQPATPEKVRAA